MLTVGGSLCSSIPVVTIRSWRRKYNVPRILSHCSLGTSDWMLRDRFTFKLSESHHTRETGLMRRARRTSRAQFPSVPQRCSNSSLIVGLVLSGSDSLGALLGAVDGGWQINNDINGEEREDQLFIKGHSAAYLASCRSPCLSRRQPIGRH